MLVKVINFFTSVLAVPGLLPSPPSCTSTSSCSNSSIDSHSIANDIWWDILLYQTTNSNPSIYNSPFSANPPVLLISLDGFRSEYLSRNLTPFLHSLGEWSNSWRNAIHHAICVFTQHCVHALISYAAGSGVRAVYLRSEFPTNTFPNHFSIITVSSFAHNITSSFRTYSLLHPVCASLCICVSECCYMYSFCDRLCI